MTALFNINFRREAHQRELARARRRLVTLGVWVTYFGIVAATMGLYGLNCAALSERVTQLERQTARIASNAGDREQWRIPPAELSRIESYAGNPRRWHDRLARLATLVPGDVRLTTIGTNPGAQAGSPSGDRLVLTGQMRTQRAEDRMAGVMQFASQLREDSLFAAYYPNVRVTSTRIIEGGDLTEFVIECQ